MKVYVGKGAADPGRTAMWKQTDPGVGVTSASYSSLATSGTNPPAANGFVAAGGSVQRLELADGTVVVDGLGDGSAWTAYTPTFTAATTNPTLGNFTRVGRWRRIGKTVHFTIVITCNSTTGQGSGTYTFGLPVSARAGDEALVYARQTGPIHVYIGSNNTINEFRLTNTATEANATAANVGFTTGTVLSFNGTYEAA